MWRDLMERTGEVSTFLAPTWIEVWLETFGDRLATRGLIWEHAGKPVGAVLLSRGRGSFGPFPVSRSYLNASGAFEVGCDHNDIVALPDHSSEIVEDLAAVLLADGADEIGLQGVRDRLFHELRNHWQVDGWQGHESEAPYVDLRRVRNTSDREYLMHLSSNTRSKIRRSVRLYEERFGDAKLALPGSEREAVSWLAELIELHDTAWEERGQKGGFQGRAKEFHRTLVRRTWCGDEDGFRTDVVRVQFGDQLIGLFHNAVYRGRVSFYQSALHYHDDYRLKPGLVTHTLAVEHYLRSGAAEYDFLGGEPEPSQYKRSLSTDRRTLFWAQLPAPTLKMKILAGVRGLRRSARSLQVGHTPRS